MTPIDSPADWPRKEWLTRRAEIIMTIRRFVTTPPSQYWIGGWRDNYSKKLGRELWGLAVKLGWPVSDS